MREMKDISGYPAPNPSKLDKDLYVFKI